jgi:hypothetical protein
MRRPRATHSKNLPSRSADRIIICNKFCNAKICRVSKIIDAGKPYRFLKSWVNNEQANKLTSFCVIQYNKTF